MLKKITTWLLIGLGLTACIAMIRDTAYNGWDFAVYHQAALSFMKGISPYQIPQNSEWSFKYPPWIVPVFLPLGFFTLAVAKWIWGFFQVGLLLAVIHRLTRFTNHKGSVFLTAFCYWFIWVYHSLAGQFTIVLLALGIFLFPIEKNNLWKPFTLLWIFTSKIFSIYSLLGILGLFKKPKLIFVSIVGLLLLSLPLL